MHLPPIVIIIICLPSHDLSSEHFLGTTSQPIIKSTKNFFFSFSSQHKLLRRHIPNNQILILFILSKNSKKDHKVLFRNVTLNNFSFWGQFSVGIGMIITWWKWPLAYDIPSFFSSPGSPEISETLLHQPLFSKMFLRTIDFGRWVLYMNECKPLLCFSSADKIN